MQRLQDIQTPEYLLILPVILQVLNCILSLEAIGNSPQPIYIVCASYEYIPDLLGIFISELSRRWLFLSCIVQLILVMLAYTEF